LAEELGGVEPLNTMAVAAAAWGADAVAAVELVEDGA